MTDARLQSTPLASRAGNGSMGQMGCRNLTVDVTWVMVKCSMGRVSRRDDPFPAVDSGGEITLFTY